MSHSTTELLRNLSPKPGRRPYYLAVGPFDQTDYDTRALYALGYWLQKAGQMVFLLCVPDSEKIIASLDSALPTLTTFIAQQHFSDGVVPICVYPDHLKIAFEDAPVRVRWRSTDTPLPFHSPITDGDEMLFCETLPDSNIPQGFTSLNVPIYNPREYQDYEPSRTETLFYGASGINTDLKIPSNAIELSPGLVQSLPRGEIINLFTRAKFCLFFKETALIGDALLSGCTAALVADRDDRSAFARYLRGPFAEGCVWSTQSEEDYATDFNTRATLDLYAQTVSNFTAELHYFILVTQQRAETTPYRKMAKLLGDPNNPTLASLKKTLNDVLLDNSEFQVRSAKEVVAWDSALGENWQHVGLIGEWSKSWSIGPRSSFMVFPSPNVKIIEIQIKGFTASARDLRSYEIFHDSDHFLSTRLRHNEIQVIRFAVFDEGRPIVISFMHPTIGSSEDLWGARGDDRQLGLELKRVTFLSGEQKSRSSEHIQEDATIFELARPSKVAVTCSRCKTTYTKEGLRVDAFEPDANIIVDLQRPFAVEPGRVFLWGIYNSQHNDMLQLFAAPLNTGAFSEMLSTMVPLTAGDGAFSLALPYTEEVRLLRLDPLSKSGVILFKRLDLAFPGTVETRRSHPQDPLVFTHLPEHQSAAQIRRFRRHSLISRLDTTFSSGCSLELRDGEVFATVENQDSEIYFSVLNVDTAETATQIVVECETLDEDELVLLFSVRGSVSAHEPLSVTKRLTKGTTSFSQSLSPDIDLSVIRIRPRKKPGVIRFHAIDLLITLPKGLRQFTRPPS